MQYFHVRFLLTCRDEFYGVTYRFNIARGGGSMRIPID
ncbi:hypothetical protein RSPO_m00512 (plasmid) [Ralstonia solanacearum Po82]|uniref:Uncharacterized protein n=1 Tax=Ralstonia solanacearum (strain Po82) TaxID=1031711 RepID=F6G9R6_RALS8|nr:hypothetical protein RSPO_m00512 [Ralstonia solanacearum Po82]